jgi:hypothetical protein
MPVIEVPGTGLAYHLITFDGRGHEQTEDNRRPSEQASDVLRGGSVTDVFIFSHGWLHDKRKAKKRYDAWVRTMHGQQDLGVLRQQRPGFQPLLVALHWPSQPWGDQRSGRAFGAATLDDPLGDMAWIAGTPRGRDAFEVLRMAVRDEARPSDRRVLDALATLESELDLGHDHPGGPPGADREPFDPERLIQEAAPSGQSFGDPTTPRRPPLWRALQFLSFWKMKALALEVGTGGARELLETLAAAAPPDARLHLVGHSFGGIVVSGMLASADRDGRVWPAHSITMLQAAMSLWSYCNKVPYPPQTPGYFHPIIGDDRLTGPIITTQSDKDDVIGKVYGLGTRVTRRADFAASWRWPPFGAVGAYGLRGPGLDVRDDSMHHPGRPYRFSRGVVHNLEATEFIKGHSEISIPAVAYAVWSAALAGEPPPVRPASRGGTRGSVGFNGVNGETGDYLFRPLPQEEVRDLARRAPRDPGRLAKLASWLRRLTSRYLDPRYDVDPTDLSASGWGLVVPEGPEHATSEILRALEPLLERRRRQAGDRYGLYVYRVDQSSEGFLAEWRGTTDGPVDPDAMPYYLLVAGGPESIPYRLQYELDVQHAVGRVHFETMQEYERYARSVVEAEEREPVADTRAVVFGPRHPGDEATRLSASRLALPLADHLRQERPGWNVDSLLAEHATKSTLLRLLGGGDTPALLFTAGHGVGFRSGHHDQVARQGALVCQEWQLPADPGGPIPRDCYLAADDIDDGASLAGLISIHFACYSAGTPQTDDYWFLDQQMPATIAPRPFTARLPRRLLSHPQGGALAVVGHIDRAWSYSFQWSENVTNEVLFADTMLALMDGVPLGHALQVVNKRYAELATRLHEKLKPGDKFGSLYVPDAVDVSDLWAALNDARGTIVLGDPAVRLRTIPAPRPATEREHITVQDQPTAEAAPAAAAVQSAYAEEALRGTSVGDDGAGRDPADSETTAVLDRLTRTLEQVATRLAGMLDSDGGLEIMTWTSSDLTRIGHLTTDDAQGWGTLQAVTRIDPDGRTTLYLREDEGSVASSVWSAHARAVKDARIHHVEFIRTAVELLRMLRSNDR